MRISLSLIAAVAITASLFSAEAKAPAYDFGPVPEWSDYQALAEAAVLGRLRDPDSVKFRWPWGMGKIYKKGLLSTLAGYASCGYVNAKNAFGGFTGETAFSVLIDHGRVVDVAIDSQPGGYIEQQCLVATTKPGGLQPRTPDPISQNANLQSFEALVNKAIASPARFGLRFTQVPDGAYVADVMPDSLAGKAGIKPGMVVERINGLAIKGLSLDQLDQMLASAGKQMTLAMVGGGAFALGAGK